MPAAPFDPRDAAAHHLLVLPGDVGPEEVDVLASSRFPRAAWEAVPGTARPGGPGRRGPVPAGVLRLSRHSTLAGPYPLDRNGVDALGVPPAAAQVYVLHAPVERGEAPWPGGGDRDGLGRAFPDGMPVRDEERVVTWLVAAARRLGGAVRIASRDDAAPATLLVPDPAAAVDLTVWTDIWLEPEAGLAVMRQAVPRAQLDLPGAMWAGPPRGTGIVPVRGAEELDPRERVALHAAADEADIAALAAPRPRDVYGAIVDLELDGLVALTVSGESDLPPVIASVPWAAHGAVAYRISWEPFELRERELERPSLAHVVARGRATPLVIAVTRAVQAAVGGEITDVMGFVVDPADL
ncbi:MAG TPA: hypothetical protein VN257_01640 [Actinotalea sp.]|nr:hypothetical protein [Actinotalea sp.]